MDRVFTRTLPLIVAFATLCMAVPNVTFAQEAQNNESDITFLKRMIGSLEQTERQAAQLEGIVERYAQQQPLGTFTQHNDRYGPRNRNTATPGTDYRLAERRVRSIKKKAIKEQKKLGELQRSGAELDPKEKGKIETTVERLARDVEEFERDLNSGRL